MTTRSWMALCAALAWAPAVNAAPSGWTTVDAAGERARIFRDDYGRPHVFASSDRALFAAFGRAVAEDRLWQLELFRRTARGTLAEILGPAALNSDVLVRTTGYTEAELDAQVAALSRGEREILQAYADGINAQLAEVAAHPAEKLPFELQALGLGVPAQFQPSDLAAIGVFIMRRFGAPGGGEAANQSLLAALTAAHGAEEGYAIFQDAVWLVDPRAYGTVPAAGAVGPPRAVIHPRWMEGFGEGAPGYAEQLARLEEYWRSLGVPPRLGSYAWALSPWKTEMGSAVLVGGPQMGFSVPEIVHEVQLTDDHGFDTTGISVAGIPAVVIGRNRHLAWSMTTELSGDMIDTYLETPCDAGGAPGYLFSGGCRPYDVREEVIRVRGGAPRTVQVLRSVHGPVVGTAAGAALATRFAFWGVEMRMLTAMLGMDRATDLRTFARALSSVSVGLNVLYADRAGNIGYWASGCNPVRPEGVDPRLPYPGDGSAEPPGGCRPAPFSINPAQGFLVNWNNKPTSDWEASDQTTFRSIGESHRVDDLVIALQKPRLSLKDLHRIPKRVADNPTDTLGRAPRHLLPYLVRSLDAVPPSHPSAAKARAILAGWNGGRFTDPVSSTALQPAYLIYSTWLQRALEDTFGDELGAALDKATANMLLHVLEDALGGGSGVPPSRDYFDGVDPRRVLSQAFDEALAQLAAAQGDDPDLWTAPRPTTDFVHPLLGKLASVPESLRSTYTQIVVLDRRRPHAENIFTLGQSGFLGLEADGSYALDPHFMDQLDLYRRFEYKPMPLLAR